MNANDYHASDAIGSTALRDLLKSAAHYHAIHVARTAPRAETEAMKRGTALHCRVLEPERWKRDYAVAPKCDRRTKEGKAAYEDFRASCSAANIIDRDLFDDVDAMAWSIEHHRAASALLRAQVAVEHSIAWDDETTGVACKGRIDLVARINGRVLLCDVKTTRDASPDGFPREVANWLLHAQASHYLDGWRTTTDEDAAGFVLIAVEPERPHAVGVYMLDATAIEKGAALRAQALELLCECRESGVWPAYGDDIRSIFLPSWAA